MSKVKPKSIKAKAIADANAILQDPEQLAKLERWFFNKEICGTVADLFLSRQCGPYRPDAFDPPGNVAEAIDRFQFPFNPRPELSGQDWRDWFDGSSTATPNGRYREAFRYFDQLMLALVNALHAMREEKLPDGVFV